MVVLVLMYTILNKLSQTTQQLIEIIAPDYNRALNQVYGPLEIKSRNDSKMPLAYKGLEGQSSILSGEATSCSNSNINM